MHYLAFWQSALVLAAVPLVQWLWLRRSFGVSGRYTALVDELRSPRSAEDEPEMNEAELIAAMRAATAEAFGESVLEAPAAPDPAAPVVLRAADPAYMHWLFFGGIAAGGLVSALARGNWTPTFGLHSELFARMFGASPVLGPLVLVGGGVLVGFGTRMAGGCTSGHGLCGVSQFQRGSLLATLAFFGTGVVTSFALRGLL